MGVGESHGHRCITRELPLQTDHRLIKGWGHEVRVHLLTNLRRVKSLQHRERGKRRKEVWIGYYELLLPDTVVTKRRHGVCQPKTIVKNPETCPDHRLRREAPGHADPRRKVMTIMNVGLRFVTEPETHGQRRPDFPVVTNESSNIELAYRKVRITRDDAELAGPATETRNLRWSESDILEQQCPAIPLNRRDRRLNGLTGRVRNR